MVKVKTFENTSLEVLGKELQEFLGNNKKIEGLTHSCYSYKSNDPYAQRVGITFTCVLAYKEY